MTDRDVSEAPVLTHRDGHALVITLNRPEVHNAINRRAAELIGAAVEEATNDPDVRVLVLTGAGASAFTAGADLKEMTDGKTITADHHDEWGFAGFVRHFASVPVIAAVEGWAIGGGTEICLACDIVVASTAARFGLPEVRRGIIPGGGGLLRLPTQIPMKRALQLIYTGEQLSAEEALDLGLVNEIVEEGSALVRALQIAARIAENAPLAVQAAKRVAWGRVGLPAEFEEQWWAHSMRERTAIGATDDAREGIAAFAEKRSPNWAGR